MADTREAVASRLRDFIQSAQRETIARFPTTWTGLSAPRPKTLLQICDEHLSKLTDEDVAELDCIIRKMTGVFGDPSEAGR